MSCQKDNDRFANFDFLLKRRGRGRWKWSVYPAGGEAVLSGSECTRAGARYKAARALFTLLCAGASRLSELSATETDNQCSGEPSEIARHDQRPPSRGASDRRT
jgi:hypothetical protein